MMQLSRAHIALCLCALLLAGLFAAGLSLPHPVPGQFGIGYGVQLTRFVCLACAQGLIYFCAVAVILRARLGGRMLPLVLGAALLFRLIVLFAPPFLSTDMYRYIWDGWVQAAGINPYRYLPADPHLAFLRDSAVFPHINRASYAHTIYPPTAEMVFYAITFVSKLLGLPAVLGMKLGITGLEGAGIWAMLKLLDAAGLPRQRVLIYAWNPLPVWEFAGNGHVDAIAVCFIALALLAASRARRGWSAAALAAATLAKFLPLVLAPVLWRRWEWRFVGVFGGLIVLLYLPYLSVGTGVFGFLGGYGAQEGIDSGAGIFPLSALGLILPLPSFAAKLYLALLAVLFLGLGLGIAGGGERTVPRLCRDALLLGGLLMAGLSPHYPWYYAWLLIPACILPWRGILFLVSASFLLYLNPVHTRLFWPAWLYVPFALIAAGDAAWARWGHKIPFALLSPKLAEGEKP